MAHCIRCGAPIRFDAGGDLLCEDCEAASGHGSGTDVPCQRCGMYLPPHELRMWNSRLYCAYCIMDIQDEEHYGRAKSHSIKGTEKEAGGESGEPHLPHDMPKTPLVCERCGKASSVLYTNVGMRLCPACASEGGAAAPAGFLGLGVLSSLIKKASALLLKPKIVAKKNAGGFAVLPAEESKNRGEEKSANLSGSNEAEGSPQNPPPSPPPSAVFDISKRAFVEKGEEFDSKQPLQEGTKKKKSVPKKAKKLFFRLHPSAGRQAKGR
ncbi:MAG: hypothetical protein N3E51_03275 [Candidatus Micrarchaeota archaeon]|nr:hypothetical protein [Candidatus Micrarchaeota archaeon]